MKAVRFHQLGGPEVLRVDEVEIPEPAAGQVRVRVAGAGFNPADGGIRAGTLPFPVSLPHVPGYDLAGTVDASGPGVDELAVGDRVVGFLSMTDDGASAEYAIAPVELLVAAPAAPDLADAAALPSVGLTAWQALFDLGGLKRGQRVLILGAGGTVGRYAVQLAKDAGAQVVATASPRSRASVAAAGADEIVDHTTTSVGDAVTAPVDLLLNLAPIEPTEFAALVGLVRDGGAVVSTTAWMPTPGDEGRGVRAETVFVRSDPAQLAHLVSLVDAGRLRLVDSRRVGFDELAEVHAAAADGSLRGKIVLVPAAD
ncbi:NADP-dependent oxidoreductase [uncultured Microbacterium sp.]|uniref:NADP-dependent oxidoreductase n=1 Tax=uncultured Microbacterium sp. TaxID=191216 RepID=UPI0028DD10FF|nr:NADP-dependent oxidoreductase [uncultured Microbacterium sp.]